MDLVVVLVVIALIVAAVATYAVLAARSARATVETAARPLSTQVNGVKGKPFVDVAVTPTARAAAPPASSSAVSPNVVSVPAGTVLFDEDPLPAPVAPPPAAPLPVAPPAATPVDIRWCKQFDPRSEALDDVARLRLIGDLGVVGKEWCVPLLSQAYAQERRPGHRQAALTALAACHSRSAAEVFRHALESSDMAERAIAADALADLEPPPQPKPRRTVERR